MRITTTQEKAIMRKLLFEMTLICSGCGNKRIEIEYRDLPEEAKNTPVDLEKSSRFLYCDRCQKYSAIFDDI
jgi:hypothetical protein